LPDPLQSVAVARFWKRFRNAPADAFAAGVNAKVLSTYMGHASVMIALDRYGHLFPGNEEEAAGLLDDYLARAVAGGE
jgi:integrase